MAKKRFKAKLVYGDDVDFETGECRETWTLEYTGTHGRTNRLLLEAESGEDAKFEAANYLGCKEEEIEY